MSASLFDECLNGIDAALWFEDCDKVPDDTPIAPTVTMGVLRTAWRELVLLRDVRAELTERVDQLRETPPPPDSHAGGVAAGLMEALELVEHGVEGPDLP